MGGNGTRNKQIQVLRVISCLMVFTVHFGQRMELDGIVKNFTDFGARGVQLFFLISGYLAAATFVGQKNVDVKRYYTKRGIAILPLYYLVILYYFITENFLNHFYSVIPKDEMGIGWLRYLFLLNGILNSDTYFWSNLGITWTIPIFVCFYLLAPWILPKIKDIRSSLIAYFAVAFVCKVAQNIYDCSIFNNLNYLFLGVVLYCCESAGRNAQATVLFGISALCCLIFENGIMAYVCLFCCILLEMQEIPNFALPKSVQALVDKLDRYSYTLYLMHGVVFCSVVDRLVWMEVPKIYIAFVSIVGTIFATWFVGTFLEKPIQSALRERFLR